MTVFAGQVLARLLLALAVSLVPLATLAPLAQAQASEDSEEQMVLWPLVTDGIEYRRVPYPRQAGPIRMIADTDVVFDVRRATVSFWPITREHLSDFGPTDEDEFVEGSLEIVDGSGEVTLVGQEAFVEWRPDGVTGENSQILTGDAATRQYEIYVQEARAAAESSRRFQIQVAEQRAAAADWARRAADDPDNPPPPPDFEELVQPQPYRSYATKPRPAAVTSLPEGRYALRLRGDDGEIVEGTERELISFGPLGRGVGYQVRPELRWTQPVGSYDPSDAVYTTGNQPLYLTPVPVEQFSAASFARLFRPQLLEAPDPAATVWVPRGRAGESGVGSLEVERGGEVIQEVEEVPYRVVQLPDVSLGYRIEEAEGAGDGADFHAMQLPGGLRGAAEVRLSIDGAAVPGSRRHLRRFKLANDSMLFLPAAVPLAVAFAVGSGTRRRKRRPR